VTEARVGKKIVCETVPVVKEYTVNVCRTVTETRTGKKTVCETVPVVKEYTVNVTTYVTEKREGCRIVHDCVEEKVCRKVSYCVLEPYEECITVPVYRSCCTPVCAPAPCATYTVGHCHGLFHRGCR